MDMPGPQAGGAPVIDKDPTTRATTALRKTRRYPVPARPEWSRRLLAHATPLLAPWIGWAIFSTMSVKILNSKGREFVARGDQPFVGTLWHKYMIFALEFVADRKVIFMSSRSADGEISTRLLRRMGHGVVRGSSSTGGSEALRELTGLIRRGHATILTPDGPKGPPQVAKLGCVLAARDSGAPLIPLGCAFSRARELGSWDRTAIPWPFSSAVMAYGEPRFVPPQLSRGECEGIRRRLDDDMAALTARCKAAL